MKSVIFIILLFLGFSLKGQNYIGLSKNEIVNMMRKTNPGFDLDEGAVNKTYKYLKYVDKYNEETWLFFLSDKDLCVYTKLMSDYSNLDIRLKNLNEQYRKEGDLKWTFNDKGFTYTIELKKEEWYFTIITRKKI
jgi:hypothetical protein